MSANPPPDPEQSQDLVRRAQGGDRAAFDALIRRNEPRLVRLVAVRMGKQLRGVEESSDVVQSALVEAVRALPDFTYRGEGSFLRWLSTIVEHKVRHHARALNRAKRRPSSVTPLESETPARQPTTSQLVQGKELEERYLIAIDAAPEPDRELLLMHLELGCTHQEIADALGIASADAVRMRVARALVRLESAMRGETRP